MARDAAYIKWGYILIAMDPKQHDQAAAGARRERLYPRQHERRQVRQALRAQRVPGKDVGPGQVAALVRIRFYGEDTRRSQGQGQGQGQGRGLNRVRLML